MKLIKQIQKRFIRSYTRNKWLLIARMSVLFIIAYIIIVMRVFWTPDMLFAMLLAIFVAFGETRNFLLRFLPLILLLLLYELFRGFADDLNGTVHFTPMITFDRWMFFGHLPTVVLQNWWWHGEVRWFDFYFYFLYMMHFFMPILLAVLIWKKAKRYYWQFMWALVALSFAAFVTYIVFPAAPPWMAYRDGYIPETMTRVSSDVWWAMGVKDFSEVYSNLPANEVAAVPSLHSAYPLLFALFVTGIFGLKKYWWVYVYPVSMWVGVVYLGEHYVIDVLLGALYAVLVYIASVHVFNWYYAPRRRTRLMIASLMARLRLTVS